MRKHIIAGIILLGSALLPAVAQQPGVITGKTAIAREQVELFARTMNLAQQKATAATMALTQTDSAPEKASSTADALKALANALNQGSNIIDSEKQACAETGMKFEDFQAVRTRLLQVKLLANLEVTQTALKGKTSGNEMNQESMKNLEDKQAQLEEKLKTSQNELAEAQASEADYFAKLDEKITKQKQQIAKQESDMGKAKNEKQRASRQKSLTNAQEKLVKMEDERKKPYKKLENAKEKVLVNEQKVAMFKEQLPAAKEQLSKMGTEIQQFQDNVDAGVEQTKNSEMMQQANLDRPVFEQFPDLQLFLLQPKTK